MKFHGFEGMLNFLKILKKNRIIFTLNNYIDDAILVSFAFVGMRCEVYIYADHIEYSIFRGSEDVEIDDAALLKLILANID